MGKSIAGGFEYSFNFFSASLYLDFWKRYSASIFHRWGMTGINKPAEHPRQDYMAKLKRTKRKRQKLNAVTRLIEPSVPFWSVKMPSYLISYVSGELSWILRGFLNFFFQISGNHCARTNFRDNHLSTISSTGAPFVRFRSDNLQVARPLANHRCNIKSNNRLVPQQFLRFLGKIPNRSGIQTNPNRL